VRMASGLPIAFFNGAFCRRPVAPSDADAVVRAAIDFFGVRAVPWLLWTRSGADVALSAACARAGLREVGGPPAMVLPAIPREGIPRLLADGVRRRRSIRTVGRSAPRLTSRVVRLVPFSADRQRGRRNGPYATIAAPAPHRCHKYGRPRPTLVTAMDCGSPRSRCLLLYGSSDKRTPCRRWTKSRLRFRSTRATQTDGGESGRPHHGET
jgi:hypothetical protein